MYSLQYLQLPERLHFRCRLAPASKDGCEVFRIGEYSNDTNAVYMRVLCENFWRRVFISGDLGCAFVFVVLRREDDADASYPSQ